jgi:predicted PurR-regulated permease PerM
MLPPANAREPSVRVVLRVVVTVVLSVLALYLVYLVRTPLFFLAVATFVSVAVSGPVNTLSGRMPRGLAITVVYSGLLLVPIVIGAILIPPAVSAISSLVGQLPTYVDDVTEFVQGNSQLQNLNEDFDLTTKLEELAQNLASDLDVVAGELANVGAGLLGSVFAVFTIVVLSIFMVSRGRQWTDALIRYRPENERRAIRRGLDRMAYAVSSYVGGALAQATVAGVAAFVVLSILGVDAPLALAVIVALLDLIPLIGATIGAFIVMLITLFTDFPTATIVWIAFAIAYQQFENYVIQPRIQARAVKLDPFIIVVAALFGGFMLGVVGALLAIPTAAAAQIAVREVIAYRRAVVAGTLDEHLADDEPPSEGPGPPDPGGEPAPDPT